MSYNKIAFSLLFLCAACSPAIARTVISCPAKIHGDTISEVDMFSGPPSEMASLVPVNGGWNTKIDNPQELPFYVQCKYKNTAKTVVIKIPENATACRYGKEINSIVCHQ